MSKIENGPWVSFDSAKLLKKAGYDEDCLNAYNHRGMQYVNGWLEYVDDRDLTINNRSLKPEDVAAPTIYQAIDWLADEYGAYIIALPTVTMDWTYKVIRVFSKKDHMFLSGSKVVEQPPYSSVAANDYATRRQALIAGVDWVLNHLP